MMRRAVPSLVIWALLYGAVLLWAQCGWALTPTDTPTPTTTPTPVGTICGGADRFWVGGTGSTDDNAHWSCASGGAGGASLPTQALNCIWDANSFSGAGQVVTMPTPVSPTPAPNTGHYPQPLECRNVDWSAVTNNPTLVSQGGAIEAFGDVTLTAGMTITPCTLNLILASDGPTATLNTGGQQLNVVEMHLGPSLTSVTWNLASDVTLCAGTPLFLQDDVFPTGHTFAGGTWNMTQADGSGLVDLTLNTNGHTMTLPNVSWGSGGLTTINAEGSHFAITADNGILGSHTIGWGDDGSHLTGCFSVTFAGSPGSYFELGGSDTSTFYTQVCIKNDQALQPPTVDLLDTNLAQDILGTFAIEPGNTINFNPAGGGSTTYVVGSMQCTGTALAPITLASTSPSSFWRLLVTGTPPACDYLSLTDSHCVASGPCYAGSHSTDGGGNVGWTFTDPPRGTPGPVVACDTLPNPCTGTPNPTATATATITGTRATETETPTATATVTGTRPTTTPTSTVTATATGMPEIRCIKFTATATPTSTPRCRQVRLTGVIYDSHGPAVHRRFTVAIPFEQTPNGCLLRRSRNSWFSDANGRIPQDFSQPPGDLAAWAWANSTSDITIEGQGGGGTAEVHVPDQTSIDVADLAAQIFWTPTPTPIPPTPTATP